MSKLKFIVMVLLCISSLNAFAISDIEKEKLKVKVIVAKELYTNGDYKAVMEKLSEIDRILGSNRQPTIENLRTKTLIKLKRYEEAQRNLDLLYTLKPSRTPAVMQDIASYESELSKEIANIKAKNVRIANEKAKEAARVSEKNAIEAREKSELKDKEIKWLAAQKNAKFSYEVIWLPENNTYEYLEPLGIDDNNNVIGTANNDGDYTAFLYNTNTENLSFPSRNIKNCNVSSEGLGIVARASNNKSTYILRCKHRDGRIHKRTGEDSASNLVVADSTGMLMRISERTMARFVGLEYESGKYINRRPTFDFLGVNKNLSILISMQVEVGSGRWGSYSGVIESNGNSFNSRGYEHLKEFDLHRNGVLLTDTNQPITKKTPGGRDYCSPRFNSHGHTVASCKNNAALYDTDGTEYRLNTLVNPSQMFHKYLKRPTGINNNGWIIGLGDVIVDGEWKKRGYILKPTKQ